MYKVLLVDDEKNIIRGIEHLINWTELNCEICGYGYNGKEGIIAAQELNPHIIITDIKMPYIDGLEMIKSIKDEGLEAKFIILSGYSEFEYAKKGIEMGVNSYILKPVDEDELTKCIESLIRELEQEQIKELEIQNLQKFSRNSHKRLVEHVLRDIVDSDFEQDSDVIDLFDSLNLTHHDTNYACIMIEIEDMSKEWLESNIDKIICTIDSTLPHFESIVFKYSSSKIALISNDINYISHKLLSKKADAILNKLISKFSIPVTIGIGDLYNNASKISKSFEEARFALSHKIIKGTNTVLNINDIKNNSKTSIELPDNVYKEIKSSVYQKDIEKTLPAIDDFFKTLLSFGNISPIELQLQVLNVILNTIHNLDSVQIHLSKFLGKDIVSLEKISRFKTVNELKNWFTNVIKTIIEVTSAHKANSDKDVIDQVKEYIDSNYRENITLSTLAEQFYINPYYLSQLFKKKTGDTYMNYITNKRINTAKELLATSDLKIYEICEKVGYIDTKYFSRIFEKIVGVKPSEYKKGSF